VLSCCASPSLGCVLGRKFKIVGLLALLAAAVSIAWQVASATLSDRELRGDLREITAQIGGRIGLDAPSSDEDLTNLVIKRASEDGVTLGPKNVTIRRTESEGDWGLQVSVDYDVPIGLFGLTYRMHFSEFASHN
jgi:hypothetical protein